MSYSHLTITDRIKIETYLDLGLKSCQIASKLGVHKCTISRELRRCQNGYSAVWAQEQYDHRAKQKGRKSCLTPKLKKKIEKVEHFPNIIEQSPKLKAMSDLLKKYDRKWDNNSVKEHNASMLSLLETEIEKYK